MSKKSRDRQVRRQEFLSQLGSPDKVEIVELPPETRTWEWMTFTKAAEQTPEELKEQASRLRSFGVSEDQLEKAMAQCNEAEIWVNDTYQVSIFRETELMPISWEKGWPKMVHLSIKRKDIEPVHDWRDLWAIKNCLIGPKNEGMELYPAEDRLVDGANQYHLWVFEDENVVIPFGMNEGRVVSNDTLEGGKQRPFPDPTYVERSV